MPKTLVIGCGYIGLAVALDWKGDGDSTTVTTTSRDRVAELSSMGLEVLLGADLASTDMKKACQSAACILVSVAPNSRYPDYERVYLQSAKQLVENLETCSEAKQVIYTGSASVYGDHNGDWVDETSPLAASNARAKILAETEQTLLALRSKGHHVCILRLGEIYGPGRQISKRLAKAPSLPGNGSNITNLIHRDDIVKAVNFSRQKELSGIYNLTNETHLSRREFYQEICQAQNLPPPSWNPDLPSYHGGRRKLSTRKLVSLGFVFSHPQYDFSE